MECDYQKIAEGIVWSVESGVWRVKSYNLNFIDSFNKHYWTLFHIWKYNIMWNQQNQTISANM